MRTIAPVELFSSLWAGGSLARIYRGYKMTNNKNETESQYTITIYILLLSLSCLPDSTRAAAFEVCWEKSWGS